MATKPSAAYSVWAGRIEECLRGALQTGDLDESKHWVTNAVKPEYAHLVAAGTNIAFPTTESTPNDLKAQAMRVMASTLDASGSVVFVAAETDAVITQLPLIHGPMFVNDSEHNHYAGWY